VRDMPALKTNSSFVSLKLIRDEEIMRAGRTRAAGLKPVRLLLFTTVRKKNMGEVVHLKCTKLIYLNIVMLCWQSYAFEMDCICNIYKVNYLKLHKFDVIGSVW
jgi:hypothetical protein